MAEVEAACRHGRLTASYGRSLGGEAKDEIYFAGECANSGSFGEDEKCQAGAF
ncbi:MAG: hypothetical protein ACI3U2_07135 [Anaerovibrio sp.]